MNNMEPWYAARTGTHQGLICEEKTGANIAVAYDKTNTAMIAAAPDMYQALKELVILTGECEAFIDNFSIDFALEAIAKAEGR